METQTQNIKKLKEEKKKLKEENKKLKQADQRRDKEWEVSEVCQMRCIQKLKEENEKLKEIIKKALDYPNGFVGLGTVSAEELRDILMDPEED
jgi:Ca2+-dependent lipid-binding protein